MENTIKPAITKQLIEVSEILTGLGFSPIEYMLGEPEEQEYGPPLCPVIGTRPITYNPASVQFSFAAESLVFRLAGSGKIRNYYGQDFIRENFDATTDIAGICCIVTNTGRIFYVALKPDNSPLSRWQPTCKNYWTVESFLNLTKDGKTPEILTKEAHNTLHNDLVVEFGFPLPHDYYKARAMMYHCLLVQSEPGPDPKLVKSRPKPTSGPLLIAQT